MIGTTISHYRILEKLGEGGMGIVYKAHDDRLDRIVALKFLPKGLEAHEQERARFLQEAKAASALNHPHICAIHALGEHENQEFIDMEFVDGVTLREKVGSGQPPVSEVISYAIQTGEALEEAHSKGIVHRDVKPENIMVNSKNQIKVMDFGLAKLKGSLKLTRTSSTVGTLAYMAPEQLQGGEVDARSDIFSFGIVLYEMLSGHPPFRGEHEAALMYSILNEEPTPIGRYRPDIPAELQHVLGRAIEKDPEERYQSVHEMLIELRRLKKASTRVVRPSEGAEISRKEERSFIGRNKVQLISSVAVILAVAAYLLLMKKGPTVNPNFTQRTIQVPFKWVWGPGISPDGKYLVFPAADEPKKWHLYLVSTDGRGEPRQLNSEDEETAGFMPNISPDGNTIVYYRSGKNEICVLPSIGGRVRQTGKGWMPKWSPDGKRIGYMLFPGKGEFWTMNPDGTDNRLAFVDTVGTLNYSGNNVSTSAFAWSPDSRSVAWVRALPQMYCEIVLHDLSTHKEISLVRDTTWKNEICWASNGQIIYSARSAGGWNLWTVPARGGSPVRITKGSTVEDLPTISGDGRMLSYWQSSRYGHLRIARLDGSDTKYEVATSENSYDWARISPNGNYIAYCAGVVASDASHIHIINRDGTNDRQLAFGDTYDSVPEWSADSRFLVYHSKRIYEPTESTKVYLTAVEKSETPKEIFPLQSREFMDTSTVRAGYQSKQWHVHLDGRPAEQFSNDSIMAISILDGTHVLFQDQHSITDGLWKVCRMEDWDRKGPLKSWVISVLSKII